MARVPTKFFYFRKSAPTDLLDIRRVGSESCAYLARRVKWVVEEGGILSHNVREYVHTHTHRQVLAGPAAEQLLCMRTRTNTHAIQCVVLTPRNQSTVSTAPNAVSINAQNTVSRVSSSPSFENAYVCILLHDTAFAA